MYTEKKENEKIYTDSFNVTSKTLFITKLNNFLGKLGRLLIYCRFQFAITAK